MSDFSLTANARAAVTAEILHASGASNATDVKGVGVWRALACDALARLAAWMSANAECSAPPYKCIWCAYPAPAHAPSHGWTVAVYATPDETL